MYVVKVRGRRSTKTFQWRPRGEKYVCNEAQAKGRFTELISAGMRGERVDGLVPYRVSIEDAEPTDIESPVSADGTILVAPLVHVYKIQYVDGLPMGAWTNT